MLLTLLILQAATPPAEEPPQAPPSLRPAPPCPTDPNGDVVVCGRAGDSPYRLRKLGDPPGEKPLPPMTVRLPGGGTANAHAHAEGAAVGGFPSNRAMVTLKFPF